ncbi:MULTISPECIES: beta-ketoacyl-ACP synthase III [Thalassospira]|jgi:3-oxoacyl-[acyl-carrier-protein] synthase-3|uniref:Beta-ketoacyl-[acyl-carrier-protein] synthase III n=3 Tax=Thalassospira TaxID=168934 RepID=A0ABR5Y3S6_9PROT|nr:MULTISPECIES: beta-ketoacyl-ACP synthase III [Thalassospira]MAL28652.1 ketoacyl-ACP synthase III [Thalassospira sp.]MBR9779347.1 ketoacyl-ACP synthase III [Rhodospirillales bacterium]AJD52108.1 3-oxoacyl-(acyl carrier protein) synthase III [Thalassospira xiamenensis M-5 = DSM 17429]KEO50701.1 3-oxoacyl-ACP synthase [Thalassospira permensis NBRC 106175]KZD05123.1 3-oxoacyl-ACP synthase [Thalassospira xiamenensis]|tara:strand:- start:120 stop:1091 length:972 start_codon:yes stop_codon:yes gene_type:complete
MTVRSRIIGCGSYLPSNVVTNDELAKRVDTSDEWIVARTGIRQRHIAAEGETTSDLAVAAATRAMEHAGVTAADIDMIIVATATPDNTFPATATKVQHRLGVVGFAFDVQAVCSGFVYALTTADMYIRNGQAKTVLVIGAETFSRILDWEDRRTCVLFGDGAGAVVVQAVEGKGTVEDQGILASRLHSDGGKYELLYVNGGPSTTQTVGFLQMEGKEVFRHAVTNLAGVIREVLADTGLEAADIDWLVPHQANRRILDSTARKFGISEDKVVITVDRHANTSAASIPLALAEAVHDGRIKRGDIVILEAMGGGFTWGAALVRW